MNVLLEACNVLILIITYALCFYNSICYNVIVLLIEKIMMLLHVNRMTFVVFVFLILCL
jgi:hypothetical protein